MGFVIGLMLTVQVLACVFLIFIVLMQPSKADGGLGASFGSGATDTLFGARTGNVLTRATIWTATILFVNSLVLGLLFSRQSSAVLKAAPPAAPAAAQKAATPPATNAAAAKPDAPAKESAPSPTTPAPAQK
jgi:preprotein translocase subunit SecG